eukprot:CAMPEP_0180322306 /NCGR_PEP_ID=MMETSP0988-20121125/36643_1 /TAXON_ID=697907 /ORGANISM="non described non described, Strain CCMP2293" /LENGTH=100 /DNA_ID=CAMNT_0022308305 /DNA_START=63 /DNA_END=362 /DNA_ORIENTATION=-
MLGDPWQGGAAAAQRHDVERSCTVLHALCLLPQRHPKVPAAVEEQGPEDSRRGDSVRARRGMSPGGGLLGFAAKASDGKGGVPWRVQAENRRETGRMRYP